MWAAAVSLPLCSPPLAGTKLTCGKHAGRRPALRLDVPILKTAAGISRAGLPGRAGRLVPCRGRGYPPDTLPVSEPEDI